MKIGKITYNGTASDSFGLIVAGAGSFDAAEPDMTAYSVPGRNGDILLDNHRYKNITVTYPAFIPSAFQSQVQGIRDWIRSSDSYARLEDNFDTTHFRQAIGKGILSFSPVNSNKAANMKLVFNCKPQRFLTTGETESTVTSGDSVNNPTQYNAAPLIVVKNPTATATFTVGTYTMTATAAFTGDVVIDCERMNIYSGTVNKNSLFTGSFPVLVPGGNTITFSGFTSFKITPRWWEL